MSETKRREAIRAAIESTKSPGGSITVKSIVAAARRNSTKHEKVLHREFGKLWNKDYAQQKALEERARELITYITVTVTTANRTFDVVAYVRDPRTPTNQQGHIAVTSEQLDRHHSQQVVLAELGRCESAIFRARNVTDVLDIRHPGLSAHLQSLLEGIVNIRQLLQAAE
jgi:hypothetical protein